MRPTRRGFFGTLAAIVAAPALDKGLEARPTKAQGVAPSDVVVSFGPYDILADSLRFWRSAEGGTLEFKSLSPTTVDLGQHIEVHILDTLIFRGRVTRLAYHETYIWEIRAESLPVGLGLFDRG